MISIQNLKKVFTINKNPIIAVDDLTLDIHEGEIFGVIGYSGAGKSTFVRLLNRLEEPTDGSILINGNEITELNRKELRVARQDIGMIFQHFNLLWSRTTEDNIAFPLEIAGMPKADRQKRVQELIDLVGLTGRENAYPSQLSGGQKQRVGIARALANNPKLLLCDEATSALDPETTSSILDLLVDINKKLGLTIILITHEMQVIQKICNRVAVMEDGKVVEVGKVFDVFSNPKQSVTKKFVEQVISEGEADDFFDEIVNVDDEGKVVRLHFIGEATNEAIISDVAKMFAVDINILQGKITQTKSGLLGTLTVQILGEEQEISRVITSLEENVSKVEVVNNDI